MSGGQLVVLDRLGRDVKRYPLPEGLATLGSDAACDIRVLLPTVSPHHATVVVHANQTVVRNVSTGETLVNGHPVSVAALRHRDTIEIGGRALRWEYTDPQAERPLAPQPALYSRARAARSSTRRGSGPPPAPGRSPALRLALELQHRASMPARQVAIVQPQRRDTCSSHDSSPPSRASTSQRGRATTEPSPARPSRGNATPQNTTKASQWIESRKSAPGRAPPARRSHSAGAGTPLRVAVLHRAQSASKLRVTKIEAPATVDHTKQAALLLMTRHAHRRSAGTHTPAPSTPEPLNRTAQKSLSKSRASNATPKSVTSRSSVTSQPASGRKSRGRPSRSHNHTDDVTLVELSDSNLSQSSDNTYHSPATTRSSRSSQVSPLLPSPKKSALKDPSAKKSTRKTESIKFDLSNLENEQSQYVFMISDVTKNADDSQSQTDITLHYDSSVNRQSPSPSPRKSIHSRSSRILEHSLGVPVSGPQRSTRTLTPDSPKPRKSSRVSTIVQNALETSGNSRYSQRTTKSLSDESYDTTVASAFKTRTLSPRSPQNNMESYSIVDLVSVDSNQSGSSIYNSMRSTKSSDIAFGTPQNSVGRKTRSTIDPSQLTSSTPYVAKFTRGSKRSLSSPNISKNSSKNTSQVSRGSRRSKSLSTPENTQKHISVNSTRVSRASRSRSRINDSDLLLISTVSEDDSPKSSKRASRATKSVSSPKSPVISPKSLSASMRKSNSVSSAESTPRSNTGRSKSILSLKSPITSPKSNVSLVTRKTKSLTPKSPILSPKSNVSVTRQSKTPVSSPSYNISRKTRSLGSSQSPLSSPKANISRKSKTPVSSPSYNTSRKTRSLGSSKSPILSPNANISVTRKSKTPVSSPSYNTSRKIRSLGSSKSPISSPKANISVTRKSKTPVSSPSYNISRKTKSLGSSKSPILSPKSTSANITRKTKSILSPKSTASPQRQTSARTTRNKLSISPANDGLSTPENRQSPVEIGTPVLSIQSLLDSSQSSLTSLRSSKKGKASLKRKTIGGIPPKPKKRQASLISKSFNLGARKTASRLSGESDDVEGTVTPKSAVKLVQEAVKNKHSTAKKPLSKRSIIDDLNESDIVKQLFNSPVKRKLSQSMTEFSRKQLFDDDDVVSVKRPTRNTVALGRTPDNSILNESGSYTPEVFVSPLGTPNNSPNLTGIKRLFRKQTPDNDLRNVKGVKGLLRTPRARRSVKNDLTRVSGVKNVFVVSPKNDLRRVTGVKSLFHSQKKTKSPKNDLRDVRGVKQLFVASSPVNDLRNVSGVKRVLRKNSPRNNLSDVRGVRNMFRQEKQRENPADVSGIEELFNESNHSYRDSEVLFDKLIGKPPIKAVYSRTFIKNKKPQKKRRRSLNIPIDEIIAKPEEWIQKELDMLLKKRSRELQRLATDTVEGSAPIRASRSRNSTIVHSESAPRKRSTAENYSAHTLPIKKRSLVNSRDNSRVSRGSNAGNTSASLGRVLPIKKRALVHSTPLKGRASAVMADLGRVSPIALDNPQGFTTAVVEAPVLQTSRRNTKAQADTSKIEIVVTSPKKTRGKVTVVLSPKKASVASPKKTIVISPKNTRNTRKNDSASKKRATVVVAKKVPVMSPKPNKVDKVKSPSPKKEEGRTRRKKLTETETVAEVIPKSPKRTRGKKVSLVVSKPSPKMKPATKAKISNAPTSVEEVPAKQRRTRKTTAPTESVDKNTESPKESARATRNRKTTEVTKEATGKTAKSKALKTNKKEESVEAKPAKTRGKKVDISVEVKKAGRATLSKKDQKPEAPKRGRKANVEVEKEPVPSKRGKKAEDEKPVAQKRGRKAEPEKPEKVVAAQKPVATRRGRNAELEVEKVVLPKRGRKSQEVEPKTTRRGRNTKAEVKPESPKKSKKTEEIVEQKPAQTRGRKTETVQKEVKAQKKGQKADKTVAQISNTSVSPKGKRGTASEPVQEKKTRGRKVEPEIEVKPTRASSKAETNRKRKSTAEEEVPRKVRKVRNGEPADVATDHTELRGRRAGRGKQSVTEEVPASRKRKAAAATPVKAAKDGGKLAKRAAKPASPVKRRTRAQPSPKVTKRATRGKR